MAYIITEVSTLRLMTTGSRTVTKLNDHVIYFYNLYQQCDRHLMCHKDLQLSVKGGFMASLQPVLCIYFLDVNYSYIIRIQIIYTGEQDDYFTSEIKNNTIFSLRGFNIHCDH